MSDTNSEFHPLADIFPMMDDDAFNELVADIEEHGLHEPMTLFEGKVLDGRNRYRALQRIDPTISLTNNFPHHFTLEGTKDEALALVISKNLKRRHLDTSQRAMVAARIANLKVGANQYSEGPSIEGSSKLLNIGHASIERAKTVLRDGVPELVKVVDQGKLAVSKAASLLNVKKYSEPVQRQIATAILAGAPPRDAIRAAKKQDYNKTTAKAKPKPLQGTYRILYADPPWKYFGLNKADEYGHAERHYDCLSDQELSQYKPGGGSRLVKEMVDDNAVLFLWVTSPLLARCFPIIKAWGFEYKTSFVWDKVKHTMGHYNSVRHEMLLICTRGSCTPDVPKLIDSVQSIERSDKHSEKPKAFYEIIEGMYDYGRKLELFSRNLRDGWDSEGNELTPIEPMRMAA